MLVNTENNGGELQKKPARLLLVDAQALPDVFGKVADAKKLLESGKAATAAEAARIAGISRSAFYKYKDAVYFYEEQKTGRILTVHLVLRDSPGILSSVLVAFANAGANILTVNQNIPADNEAMVSISARVNELLMPVEQFIRRITDMDGVERVLRISGED